MQIPPLTCQLRYSTRCWLGNHFSEMLAHEIDCIIRIFIAKTNPMSTAINLSKLRLVVRCHSMLRRCKYCPPPSVQLQRMRKSSFSCWRVALDFVVDLDQVAQNFIIDNVLLVLTFDAFLYCPVMRYSTGESDPCVLSLRHRGQERFCVPSLDPAHHCLLYGMPRHETGTVEFFFIFCSCYYFSLSSSVFANTQGRHSDSSNFILFVAQGVRFWFFKIEITTLCLAKSNNNNTTTSRVPSRCYK